MTRLAEALDDWLQEYVWILQKHAPKVTLEPLEVIADAARKWFRLTVSCETCGGSGKDKPEHSPAYPMYDPCPDCTDGRKINPEAVLVAEDAYFEAEQGTAEQWRNPMEYALRAVIEWAGRKEE